MVSSAPSSVSEPCMTSSRKLALPLRIATSKRTPCWREVRLHAAATRASQQGAASCSHSGLKTLILRYFMKPSFVPLLYNMIQSADTSSRLRRACIRMRVAAAVSWSSAASSWRICRTAATCVMSLTLRQPPSSPVPSSLDAVACCLAASAACEQCCQHAQAHVMKQTSDPCMWQ